MEYPIGKNIPTAKAAHIYDQPTSAELATPKKPKMEVHKNSKNEFSTISENINQRERFHDILDETHFSEQNSAQRQRNVTEASMKNNAQNAETEHIYVQPATTGIDYNLLTRHDIAGTDSAKRMKLSTEHIIGKFIPTAETAYIYDQPAPTELATPRKDKNYSKHIHVQPSPVFSMKSFHSAHNGGSRGLESELVPMKCTTATNNAEMCANEEHFKRRKYPRIIEFSEGECRLSKTTPFQESMHSVQQCTREARQNAEFIPKVSSTEALCTAGRVLHGGNSDSNDSYSRSKRLSLPIGEGNNNAHAQTGATTPDSSAIAESYSSAVAESHSTTNENIVAHSPALGKARAAALLLNGMKIEQQQERRNNSLRFKPELEKKIDTTTICNTHAQHTGLPKINYSDSKNYKGCMNKHMRRIVVDSSDHVLDTNNTNIKQLRTRKYNQNNFILQKEINIADRLKESKFVFISDNIILNPFDKGLTRFISSCVTANRVPIYVCVACSYHTRVKSHFNHHHLTQKHMNNLDTWSIRQIKIETKNDRYTHTNSCISTQDNLESQISSNIQIEERIEPVHERKNSNAKIAIEPVHERKNSNE
jgi:hypothetical protein